jgi:hypothetical protein
MQVRQQLDIGERRADRLARGRFLRARADERGRHRVQSQRGRRDATNAQRDTPAGAGLVERDLRRRRGKGEIAAAGVDLVKTDADARVAGSAVIIGPMKKSAAAISAVASPSR